MKKILFNKYLSYISECTIFLMLIFTTTVILYLLFFNNSTSIFYMEITLFVSVLLSCFIHSKIFHYNTIKNILPTMGIIKKGILCWSIIFITISLSILLPVLLNKINLVNISFIPPALMEMLLFYLLVSLVEEIIFRGFFISRGISNGLSEPLLVICSSLLFMLAHIVNSHVTIIALLNIFLAGIFLGLTYIFTKNLWIPIFLHWAWNFIQGNIFGFSVSGTNSSTSILHFTSTATTYLDGEGFGYEGTLMCTITLVTLICLTLFNRKRIKE